MLLWLNKHTKSSFTSLKQYKSATGSETVDMAEDFQFDNTFEAQESADPFGLMGLFDDISSDEESMKVTVFTIIFSFYFFFNGKKHW